MDLSQLLAGHTADVKVEWDGIEVLVSYRKNAYTPKLEAEVMSASETGGGQALADLLVHLLESWDIVQNGEPFPPSRENIGILPVAFLVQVMKAIAEAMQSDPLLSATSDAPS